MNKALKHIIKYNLFLSLVLIFIFSGVVSTNKVSLSNRRIEDDEAKLQLFKPVIKKAIEQGIDSSTITNLILDPNLQFNENYVKIEVPLKQVNKDQPQQPSSSNKIYNKLVNDEAIKKINNFIEQNAETFRKIQENYGVSKEVLASLLWVETRHGDYLGYHHVLSIFATLSLCDQPEFLEYNLQNMRHKAKLSKSEYIYVKKALIEKSRAKAKWAINELVALIKIKNKLPVDINELYGSYAGAFGIPQFLPSSLNKWAVDANGDGKYDLFDYSDAIFSAANYLKKHGFDTTEYDQRKSLFAYNHSTRYVNTIMLLSQKVKEYQESIQSPEKGQ